MAQRLTVTIFSFKASSIETQMHESLHQSRVFFRLEEILDKRLVYRYNITNNNNSLEKQGRRVEKN